MYTKYNATRLLRKHLFRESQEDALDRIFNMTFGECYDSEEEADILRDEYYDAQDEVDK